MDSNSVLLLCFFAFIGIALKWGYRTSLKKIDEEIEIVSHSLEDATRQLKEAEEQHHQEMQKSALAEKAILDILNQTHFQIQELEKSSRELIEHINHQHSEHTSSQIQSLIEEAKKEINQFLINHITKTIKEVFDHHILEFTQKQINDSFLNELERTFDKK